MGLLQAGLQKKEGAPEEVEKFSSEIDEKFIAL